MVTKFEVGRTYFCYDTRYASDGKTFKKVTIKWLCVKRNNNTGYVSLQRLVNGKAIGQTYSRKVESSIPYWSATKEKIEEVKIGYGGSGAWRNWYHIYAENVED